MYHRIVILLVNALLCLEKILHEVVEQRLSDACVVTCTVYREPVVVNAVLLELLVVLLGEGTNNEVVSAAADHEDVGLQSALELEAAVTHYLTVEVIASAVIQEGILAGEDAGCR